MAETIDPGTGLPVGLQPTPVAAFDFSKGFESIQNMLDKIGQGQVNLKKQKEKDALAWENAMMDFPEGDYIEGDEEEIQKAVDLYNDKAVELKDAGYDLRSLPTKERKELEALKKDARQKAVKAKANINYFNEVKEDIDIDDGVKFDSKYAGDWLTDYNKASFDERVAMRKSSTDDDGPYQKNYNPSDVVVRAAKITGMDVSQEGSNMETYYNIDRIIETIEKDALGKGIGRRMYERNKLPDETERQFAERMGILAENILKMEKRPIRASHGRTTTQGVYIVPGLLSVEGKDGKGVDRVFTDSSRTVNALKLKGSKASIAPTITIGDPQNSGMQVTMDPTSITIDADGNYWVHGRRKSGVGLSDLDLALMLDDEAIQTINNQYDMDIVADFSAAEQAEWDKFAK